jgi:hypothetical protein
MNSSRIASLLGVMGGLTWVAAAIRGWGADSEPTLEQAGMGLLGLCLAAVGYTLVRTAPIWLRLVLMVAASAFGYMVWITVRDAFPTDHVPVLVGGVVMITAGLIGLGRRPSRPVEHEPVHGGRRAAR